MEPTGREKFCLLWTKQKKVNFPVKYELSQTFLIKISKNWPREAGGRFSICIHSGLEAGPHPPLPWLASRCTVWLWCSQFLYNRSCNGYIIFSVAELCRIIKVFLLRHCKALCFFKTLRLLLLNWVKKARKSWGLWVFFLSLFFIYIYKYWWWNQSWFVRMFSTFQVFNLLFC